MSYLRRLAQETTARFQPRRIRGFAAQNTLRVEETFVEALRPQPESLSSPISNRAASTAQAQPIQMAGPGESSRASEPARHVATEVRREFPDAIEESVEFDASPKHHSASQQMSAAPSRWMKRESPDPQQAESVLARVRALTRDKGVGRPSGDADTRSTFVEGSSRVRLEADSERQQKRMPPPDTARAAEEVTHSNLQSVQEPRGVQPVASSYSANAPFSAKHENVQEGTQLSIGSIVVHIEPEAPAHVAPPAARPRLSGSAAADSQSMDSRWMRSYLDRN
jgi:hypothetical protein